MPSPQITRELSEMVEQLDAQLGKLEAFSKIAFGQNKEEYLPEVATKLRVLLVRSRHNKPLLLDVAESLGIPLDVRLDGPPGLRWSEEQPSPMAGDVLSLNAFFDLDAVIIRTSRGLVSMTKRELIRAWCEQLGGAHEDWSVDEALINALRAEIRVFGIRPIVMELRNCAQTALQYGQLVVATAKRLANDAKLG